MTTSNQNTNAAVANTTITTTTTTTQPLPAPAPQPSTTTTIIANNNNNNSSGPIHTRNTTATNAQQQQQQNTTITGAVANCAIATTPTTPTPTTTATTTRSMQSDEDFNIRFVNLVRTHKCLYDKKVPEYRNRDNQEKAWSLISQETRESVIHCKERWRNLRACLSRYIKQQSGADPQHKPYYLTEHMAFLLPFLKSTRNSLDNNGNNSTFATLYHLSQQHQHQHQQQQLPPLSIPHMNGNGNGNDATIQLKFQPQLQLPISYNNNNGTPQLDVKHSLSDNEDEETIDAFDPAITASLQQHMQQQHQQQQQRLNNLHSPALSDTASANTLQNFIPDVQLAELRTPDASQAATDLAAAVYANNIGAEQRRQSHDETIGGGHSPPAAKRIKTECHASEATSTAPMSTSLYVGGEHADMEFFRSILPDIAALTPQQKRKFKIGVLELIDDVVERYPIAGERNAMSSNGSSSHNNNNNNNNGSNNSSNNNSRRRNSAREWRK